ncbi:serine hydrolase [Chryseobacterium vrystaatense]|uniref:serine hydrolase n=1 Tax=Chryseobacterium vrystaatense TaxID=307480 RepID=UPI00068A848D|nr:serine hydrolase [Chryseobacterium vrystaatense]
MKHTYSLIVSLLMISLLQPVILMGQSKDPLVDAAANHLKKLAENDHFSGVVLIAKDGKAIFSKAYGFANLSDSIPNRLDTRFNLASLDKMFTAMAVMQLVQADKISTDATVGRYLPNYMNRTVADSVTIHQLLTHTSGMGSFWEEYDKVAKEKYKTVDDYLPLFVNKPLLLKPGTRYLYSNSGYTLLGKIIEQVSGKTYFDYVKQHIFLPAKMYDTDALELDDVLPRIATGYTMSQEHPGSWKNNTYANVVKGGPAGGSYATAADLLRFANAVVSNSLLNQENTERYIKGKVRYEKGSYAYGMSTDTINGHMIFGHTGGHLGIADELMICPDLGYTVVILTNGEVENYWEISNFIKSKMFGRSSATDHYFFTKSVIEATVKNGVDAGIKRAGENKDKLELREGIIERWAYHNLFDMKNKEALSLFLLNARSFPKSSNALYNLAEGYRLTGNNSEAVAVFEQYLKLEPDDAEVKEKIRILKKASN